MFVQPVANKGIRTANIKRGAFPAYELRRFKPGVVALRTNLFFDFSKNFFPGIHEKNRQEQGTRFPHRFPRAVEIQKND
jgi:hypothetical protein